MVCARFVHRRARPRRTAARLQGQSHDRLPSASQLGIATSGVNAQLAHATFADVAQTPYLVHPLFRRKLLSAPFGQALPHKSLPDDALSTSRNGPDDLSPVRLAHISLARSQVRCLHRPTSRRPRILSDYRGIPHRTSHGRRRRYIFTSSSFPHLDPTLFATKSSHLAQQHHLFAGIAHNELDLRQLEWFSDEIICAGLDRSHDHLY